MAEINTDDGRLTFPKLDNPLCSGLPSALSTFEQSALKKKTRFTHLSFPLPPFLLGLDSGRQQLLLKYFSMHFWVGR